ncbi:hypothetical protein NDU88_005280 [Pleurodeles waltl]|uniref:Reverse transcriptase domain-containing protein n=1 Tax=Pleurodeles waltl TaxID=8319 RepID=A0AAV7TV29_PLEWA|nr:hypothetical protein NDU88_005280 [Pleurodeles waltl]
MYYPGTARQKPDILDIAVMKNLSQSMELETLTAVMPDHNPVLITIGNDIKSQQGAMYNYKKAPEKDRITNQAIKMLPNTAVDCIAEIFYACIQHQYFPKGWKEERVIIFPRVGKPVRDPANYCPIILLSSLSELFEKVILACLSDFASNENLIAEEQHGFRKEHSTNHQLFRVAEIITQGFNINKSTRVVFLDVAKAFDRVWHRGLIYKLIKLKFPSYLVNLLTSYLEGHTFHVVIQKECATVSPILAEVTQGSIVGPFLFNIFINYIPKDLKRTDIAIYANDVAVISQSFSEGSG